MTLKKERDLNDENNQIGFGWGSSKKKVGKGYVPQLEVGRARQKSCDNPLEKGFQSNRISKPFQR